MQHWRGIIPTSTCSQKLIPKNPKWLASRKVLRRFIGFLVNPIRKSRFSDFFHCSKIDRSDVYLFSALRIFDFISIPVGPSVGQKPSIYYGRKIIRIVAPKCKPLITSPKFWGVSFLLRSFARRKRGVFSSGFHGGTYNLWDQLCESTDWVVDPKHPTSHSGLRSGIFKDLLFSPLPGEMVQFDFFCCSNGW